MSGNYDLCQSARELAEVIGRNTALDLIDKYLRYRPGHGYVASIYVPKSFKPDHVLVKHVGPDNAAKMVKEFGGMDLKFSSSRTRHLRGRNDEIIRMAANDVSNHAIAARFNMTERHVRNIIRGIPRDAPTWANDNDE